MDELTQMPSRLGQVSTAIAVLDLVIVGLVILVAFLASGFISFEQIEIRRKFEFAGFIAFFIFPLVSIVGLIIGGIAFFQPSDARFYKILGLALNGFNLVLWIGIIFYQITFNASRFRI